MVFMIMDTLRKKSAERTAGLALCTTLGLTACGGSSAETDTVSQEQPAAAPSVDKDLLNPAPGITLESPQPLSEDSAHVLSQPIYLGETALFVVVDNESNQDIWELKCEDSTTLSVTSHGSGTTKQVYAAEACQDPALDEMDGLSLNQLVAVD